MTARQRVLAAGGAYYVATGVFPFVSRRAFEAITGPKREWWLVQTVGATVTAIGAGMLSAATRDRDTPEVVAIGAGAAAGLAAIDVVYHLRGRLRWTYLVDAAAEAALLGGLALTRPRRRRAIPSSPT